MKRWAEQLNQELLNRPAPAERPNIPAAETDLEISCYRPSRGEIKRAIGLLKNGKAVGPHGIPTEAIKAGIDTSTDMLYNLLGKIWQEEVVPDNWKMRHLVKLPIQERQPAGLRELSRNNAPISARKGSL